MKYLGPIYVACNIVLGYYMVGPWFALVNFFLPVSVPMVLAAMLFEVCLLLGA